MLLKAFEILAAERPGLRLLVAGPAATPTSSCTGCPRGCASGPSSSARSARRTRCACCTRSTCSARRTPAASPSASSPPRRWRPACRSWPATSRRSARCCGTAGRASCSPPATPPTWRARRGGCSTTRRGAPSSRSPRWPRWRTTTGRSSPGTCSASTRPWCSAAGRVTASRRVRPGRLAMITYIVLVVSLALWGVHVLAGQPAGPAAQPGRGGPHRAGPGAGAAQLRGLELASSGLLDPATSLLLADAVPAPRRRAGRATWRRAT